MLAAASEGATLFRYRFGDTEFDEARFELLVGGESVEIQPKPLELLALLLRTPGEVVTSEEILQSVWKYQNPGALETNVIGTALTKLRSALGKDARRIVNLPRVGYRFEGRVERVVVGRALASGLSLEPGMAAPLRPGFVLRELLSRSGFSEVWRARHGKTGEARIYKFSPDGERLGALKREATLSRLLHDTLGERPDLVRVLAWNFSQAPYFLECEDGGQNLRQWAEESGRLRAMGQAQRIALFLQIADAVAAAHGVGVLHKDLKPDNVLIAPLGAAGDERWQVRLTDFGSGQLLEPGRLADLGITRLGFTATRSVTDDSTTGTLLYLAPELTRGEPPTIQSDVYALGLLLYQLLVGEMRRPLVTGWQREVTDELLQQDIAAATDGNPAHRLSSAGALASGLRRLEERRALLERQRALEQSAQEAQEALKRTRARRPWLIASLVSLALGLVASTWLQLQSHRAYLAAEQQRSRAEAINTFLNDDLLGAADPGAPGAQHDPTVKQLLARAAQRLDGRFGDDPATKASLDLTIGRAYFGLSDYANAESFQRRSIAQLATARGAADVETIEAQYLLSQTLAMEGRYADTLALIDQADAVAGARLQQPTRLAMTAAWARGNYYVMLMKPPLALPYFEQAERWRVQALPGDDAWLARVHSRLASCYERLDRNAEALAALQPLLAPAYTPERLGLVEWEKIHLSQAQVLANLGRYDEAERDIRETLRQVQRVMGEDNFMAGQAWDYLGGVYQSSGRWRESIEADSQAYAIIEHAVGPQSRYLPLIEIELDISRYYTEGPAQALPQLQRARAAVVGALGDDSLAVQIATFYIASALADLGRPDEAATMLDRLHTDKLNVNDLHQHWDLRTTGLHGVLLMRLGQPAQGRAMVEDALARLVAQHAQPWMLQPLQAALDGSGNPRLARR
jgi:non-specific serine/threonine protein kinase